MTRPLRRRLVLLLLCSAALACAASDRPPAASVHRVALVIGNDSYKTIARLENARADATAMAESLRASGFEVTLQLDLDQRAFKAALRGFKARLTGGDDAVFFYAGHGVEFGGSNYLLPIDVESGDSEDMLKDDGIRLQRILNDLRDQKARFSLAIIDACRENPFKQSGREVPRHGLAPTSPATGQMVIYSAGAGQSALDGLGNEDRNPHGLFTRVFLAEMAKPGVPVDQMVRHVRDEVARLAATVRHEQVPALYDQTLGAFYFRAPSEGAAATVASAAQGDSPLPRKQVRSAEEIEDEYWSSVEASNDRADFEDYLKRYPDGRYALLAGRKMRQLASMATPQTAPGGVPSAGATLPEGAGPRHTRPLRDCATCPDMVVLPAGRFPMGSPPEEEGRQLSEGPVRTVDIVAPFAIGRSEVTVGDFRRFVDATGYRTDAERNVRFSGCYATNAMGTAFDWLAGKSWRDPGFVLQESQAVSCVSWNDARNYAQWLSRETGQTYRLPSEAEWEYAARAGTTAARFWGDTAVPACGFANVADETMGPGGAAWKERHSCSDGRFYVAPVASYRPNDFGLYDMLGNVWEWTEDCWNDSHAGAPTDGRARTQGDCARRVLRGGSWNNGPRDVRSASRDMGGTTDRYTLAGFRVVRSLP